MLRSVNEEHGNIAIGKSLKEINADAPFDTGLEYGCPARGAWNIVHTGFLVPECHEVFVCAANCLRGVVLTAAEMGTIGQFSTVTIKENNVLDGNMEELLIDGVTSIIKKLKKKPRAILVYTSCIHHFMALDLDLCYKTLRKRFPKIKFTDCYMNPIMRKSGMTPDELMRRQLYSLIDKTDKKDNGINILGNNYATDESSDLVRLIRVSKYKLRDITYCKTFDEYEEMGKSKFNIAYLGVAKKGLYDISNKLDQEAIFIPISYDPSTIKSHLKTLADTINVDINKFDFREDEALTKLKEAKKVIGNTAIAIDYTFTPATLSLAKLLLDYDFNVKKIYIDSIGEKDILDEIKKKYSDRDIMFYPTVNVAMRKNDREQSEKYLALGQKAAYFTNTNYFVNEVECGGHYGFDGIKRLAEKLIEANSKEKDASILIQKKGLGCNCLL
ncbi:MAG: nitrogenase [Lachnospiraceae bacterium]|nr:nitrogenase [Lachnospiraceae bacterium]